MVSLATADLSQNVKDYHFPINKSGERRKEKMNRQPKPKKNKSTREGKGERKVIKKKGHLSGGKS